MGGASIICTREMGVIMRNIKGVVIGYGGPDLGHIRFTRNGEIEYLRELIYYKVLHYSLIKGCSMG